VQRPNTESHLSVLVGAPRTLLRFGVARPVESYARESTGAFSSADQRGVIRRPATPLITFAATPLERNLTSSTLTLKRRESSRILPDGLAIDRRGHLDTPRVFVTENI